MEKSEENRSKVAEFYLKVKKQELEYSTIFKSTKYIDKNPTKDPVNQYTDNKAEQCLFDPATTPPSVEDGMKTE